MAKESNVQLVTNSLLAAGEQLNIAVSKTKTRKKRGSMLMVGLGEGGSFNTFKAIRELSNGAYILFWDYVIPNRNWNTNHIGLTPIEVELPANRLSDYIREIINVGLMLKIKNGLYMLNPRAIFVADKYADAADQEYTALSIKKKK